jgi:prepilin-type N-terminal cleavage/methylation domain-containing protein
MNIFKQKNPRGLPAHQIWHYCTVFWMSLNRRKFCTKKIILNNVNNSNKKTMPKLVSGFTLVELLVVISIIAFLSSVVLASMQSARDKAITAKINEDMRNVKIATEMYFGDKNSYTFTAPTALDNINKVNLVDNRDGAYLISELNLFSIKKVNAQASIPDSCKLFNDIAGILVNGKYLSSIPVHPRQNYADSICYKAATSSDGTYVAMYAETPETILVGPNYVKKSIGFVAGDASIPNFNKIRVDTNYEFLRTSSSSIPIGATDDILDEVVGITSGQGGGRSCHTVTTLTNCVDSDDPVCWNAEGTELSGLCPTSLDFCANNNQNGDFSSVCTCVPSARVCTRVNGVTRCSLPTSCGPYGGYISWPNSTALPIIKCDRLETQVCS